MTDFVDEQLTEHFARLRAADGATAPAFHAMWERAGVGATAAPGLRARMGFWIAAAAVVVVAAGVVVRAPQDRDRNGGLVPAMRSGARPTPSITDWISPTEGLLRTSATDLLAPPSILSSTLDGATRAFVDRHGDRK